MLRRRTGSLGLAIAAFACGVDVVGAPPADDAGARAEPPPICLPCAPPQAEPPFEVVLFGDRAGPCPAGFDAVDLVEAPTARAGSCGCGPCAFAGTTCSSGRVGSRYSADTACDGTGGSVDVAADRCVAYSGRFISTHAAVVAPPAVVGACSAPGVGVRANVDAEPRRACTRRADTCAEALCAPAGALRACLVAPGDVACPDSAPAKHLVGADVAIGCPACTCTARATCGGSMTYYPQAGCTGAPRVLEAGVCTRVDQASIASLRWTGVIASQECADLTPAPSADVSLTAARTVCCP